MIGFTGVALIGRVGDLVRPYLVAKKTGLPLSSQVAVYVVERLFDMGSLALILSLALLLLPQEDASRATNLLISHSSLLSHAPGQLAPLLARYGGLILTLLGGLFLVAVRLGGDAVAAFFEHLLGLVSRERATWPVPRYAPSTLGSIQFVPFPIWPRLRRSLS